MLPRHISVRFCFFAQKGVLKFQNKKFYCPKDSKKVNIFEIGLLEVYDGGGGCPESTLYCVLTCISIVSQSAVQTLFGIRAEAYGGKACGLSNENI